MDFISFTSQKRSVISLISKFLREYLIVVSIDINDSWTQGLVNSNIFPYINLEKVFLQRQADTTSTVHPLVIFA